MAGKYRSERADQGEPSAGGCSPGAGVTLAGLVFESADGLRRICAPGLEKDLGVSGQAVEVLIRMIRSPGETLRMVDLAAQTGLTPGGLTRAVDRLVEAGFVRRHLCGSDRRVVYAALTDSGAARTAEALGHHEAELAALLAPIFDGAEAEALVGLLRRLRDRVNPSATQLSEPLDVAVR